MPQTFTGVLSPAQAVPIYIHTYHDHLKQLCMKPCTSVWKNIGCTEYAITHHLEGWCPCRSWPRPSRHRPWPGGCIPSHPRMETRSCGSEASVVQLRHQHKGNSTETKSYQPVLLAVLLAVADEHHRVVDVWLGLVASVENAALVGTPVRSILMKREEEEDH